jgi:hypothetical protein
MTIVGSALSAIQVAIGEKLTDDTALMALITGVFDFRGIPKDQAFPYVTVGDTTETDDSTFDTLGYEDTFTLHIWSIQPGTQECQQILANLNRLLNHQPLNLANMSHVGTWYDLSWTLPDPADTRITHMPVRYRIGAGEL